MRPFRLAPPQPARQLVTRPRLLALLGERFERRLVLVVAGAGFGKSTVLAQAVSENRMDPRGVDVWLGCSLDDAAASQLAAGLLAALNADPSGVADPVAAISAAVWQRAPAEVALLLDDVHLLPSGSPGAALLAELVRALPANAHVVFAGRRDPPLGWSRLAATGEVQEVREADLSFGAEELEQFAQLRHVPSSLLAGAHGWPALAELTATTGHSRIADFLWEEILSALPKADRRLLAAVAAAGGVDDEVATALGGGPAALPSLLGDLPLISGDNRGWYRLHALWHPALAGELRPAEAAEVRRTAGRVLHARGDVAAAARLYADAAAWDDLDRLIVDACQSTYPLVGNDVLGEWLRRLPPARRGQPAALLLEGTLLQATDLPAAQARLLPAAEGYRAADDLIGEVACLSHLALVAWWLRDSEVVGRLLPRVAELTSSTIAGPAGDSLAALSAWVRLVDADVSGDTLGALAVLESITVTRFAADWQTLFDFHRALQHVALGDPGTALVFTERAAAHSAVTVGPGTFSVALSCLHLLGRLDEVVERVSEMFAVPQMVAQLRIVELHSLAAMWLAWAGRPEQAATHLREAEQVGRTRNTPMTKVFLTAGRLGVALADNDEDAAALAAHLRRLCDGQPSVARLVDRGFLAVQYVLVPSTRDWWDEQSLDGCFAVGRDLARTVVALRDGDAPDLSQLPAPGMLRAFLPPRWVAELAAAVGGRPDLAAAAANLLAAPIAPVHLRLLGSVELLRGGTPVTHKHLRRDRVRELLAYLVVHRSASRENIAADLWPELGEAAASRNLRVTLTYLTQLLEPDRPAGTPSQLLRRAGNLVELVESPLLTADVWTVDRLLDEASHAEQQRAPSVALAGYQEAIEQYAGSLLGAEPGPEWLLPHRDRLRRRFVAAAVRAGELLLATRATAEPLRLAQRAITADEWSESAHQLLVSAHLAGGDMTAARLALQDCHRMLRALGAQPDARTRMLSRRLLGAVPQRGTPPAGRPRRGMTAPRSRPAVAP